MGITHIYVLDQAERVVVMQNLDPSDRDIASINFTIPSGVTSLTAFEYCNLHGLWRGPTVQVSGQDNAAPSVGETDASQEETTRGLAGFLCACFCTMCAY